MTTNQLLKIKKSIFASHLFWGLLIVGLTFLVFSPTLTAQFTNWDDMNHVLDNPQVQSLNPIPIFTGTVSKTYCPLTVVSFAIDYHWHKFDAHFYHLTNLLLHLANIILVYYLAILLGFSFRTTILGTLLFAIHPMHVESVAWITERKDVLYSFFYLAAMIFYIHHLNKDSRRFYWLSLIAGLLSILSKAMALSLPLVLFAIDWYKGRTFNKKMFADKLPFFAMIIPIASITFLLNHKVMAVDGSLIKAILLSSWTFMFYVQKFLFPFPIIPYYTHPQPISLTNPHYLWTLGSLLLWVGLLIKFRKNKLFIFSSLFYLLSIFFLVRHKEDIVSVMVADRFMYLPSLMFCFLISECLFLLREKLPTLNRKKWYSRIMFTALLLLMLQTHQQVKVWDNSISITTDILNKLGDHAQAYNNRGSAYAESGELDKALNDFNQAIKTDPEYSFGYNNRANLFKAMGEYKKALDDYNQALKIRPDFAEALHGRGQLYLSLNQPDLALTDYSKSIEFRPHYQSFYDRAKIYIAKQQFDLALADLSKSIKFNPKFAEAYNDRGMILMLQKKFYQALNDYDFALKLNPKLIEAFNNRGNLFSQKKYYADAIINYDEALKIKPDYAEAYFNRGNAYANLGYFPLALNDYSLAIEYDPNSITAYFNRSLILQRKGDYKNALTDALQAKKLGYPVPDNYLQQLKTQNK